MICKAIRVEDEGHIIGMTAGELFRLALAGGAVGYEPNKLCYYKLYDVKSMDKDRKNGDSYHEIAEKHGINYHSVIKFVHIFIPSDD